MVLPLRLITGSSATGAGSDSGVFTFSTDDFREFTLLAAVTFGVVGVGFGVAFALGSDFTLAEPLGFNTMWQ